MGGEIAKGMKLSEAYDRMIQLGWLQKSRRINEDIMRSHFEKQCGMVKSDTKKSSFLTSPWFYLFIGVVSTILYFGAQQQELQHSIRDVVESTISVAVGRI